MYYHMSDIFICKHCNKEMGIKQFGRHLLKTHNQKYEDYVKDNLKDFERLNWKLCSACGILFRGISLKCGNCYTKNHQIKEDQYIPCHCCNQPIHSKVISIHLKSHHNIEFLDYVKEHLKDFEKMGWCKCVICGNITKNTSKKHNEPTCSQRCHSKIQKNWTGEKSNRFGVVLLDETKEKISEKNIEFYSVKENHPFFGKKLSNNHKEKISQTRIERGVAKGQNNPMFGKTHTPEAIKKIFSHRKMNKLERLVADELDKAGIKYTFQFFIVRNGICKSYDFKIKRKPTILEVDGDFWHGNPTVPNHYEKSVEVRKNDKVKTDLANERGYKVVRLWEKDIKANPSIVVESLR